MERTSIPVATSRRTLLGYQAQDGNGGDGLPEPREQSAGAEILTALTENTKAMQALLRRMDAAPAPLPAPERDPRRETMREMAD